MNNEVLLHISEKPWGEISEADYTIEQWHAACLIHLHEGPPTSKSQCKLPVKTPNGALNRNGVHAAAAALAGARSPLKAPPEQKAKAAAALRRYYSQLDETPPESLMEHTNSLESILEHFGVKGMKWGVRTKRALTVATGLPSPKASRQIQREAKEAKKARKKEVVVTDKRKKIKTSGGAGHPASSDAVRARTIGQVGKKSGLKALSDEDLQTYSRRLQLEQSVKRLNYNEMNPGKKFVMTILGRSGNSLASEGVNAGTKKLGKKAVTLAMAAA